jgi:hypothetical protein
MQKVYLNQRMGKMKRVSPASLAYQALKLIPLLLLAAAAPATLACGKDSTGPCCKTCTNGKPCGDTCIAKTDVCNVGAGCACSGAALDRFLAGR